MSVDAFDVGEELDAHQINDTLSPLELPVETASLVRPSPLNMRKSSPGSSHAVNSLPPVEVHVSKRPVKTLTRRESRITLEFNRLIHRVKNQFERKSLEMTDNMSATSITSPSLSFVIHAAVKRAGTSSRSLSRLVDVSPARSLSPSSLFSQRSATTSTSSCSPWSSDCNSVDRVARPSHTRRRLRSRRRAPAEITPPPLSSIPTPTFGPVSAPDDTTSPGLTLDDFEIITLIGEGAFGKVYLAKLTATDRFVALKLVSKNMLETRKTHETEVLSEQVVMRAVEGVKGTLPLLASWHDNAYWYFAMEYMPYGDLRFQLKRRFGKTPPALVRFYVAQMIVVLEELHTKNIIHRDVKPANILIDDMGNAVLADFGLSRLFDAPDLVPGGSGSLTEAQLHLTMRGVGTLVYMAPEVLAGTLYSHEIDFWALGVVTYEMLTGELPFGEHHDPKVLAHAIQNEDVTFWRNDVEPVARDFIRKVLAKDPSDRLTVDQMKAHSFFSDIDWNAIANRTAKAPFVPPTRLPTVKDFNCVVHAGEPYLPGRDPHPEFTYTSSVLTDPPKTAQVSRPRLHSAAYKVVHAMSRFLARLVHETDEPEFAIVAPPTPVAFGEEYTAMQVQRGGQWRTAVMPNFNMDMRMSMPVMAHAGTDVHHGHLRGRSWVRGVGSRAFGKR